MILHGEVGDEYIIVVVEDERTRAIGQVQHVRDECIAQGTAEGHAVDLVVILDANIREAVFIFDVGKGRRRDESAPAEDFFEEAPLEKCRLVVAKTKEIKSPIAHHVPRNSTLPHTKASLAERALR